MAIRHVLSVCCAYKFDPEVIISLHHPIRHGEMHNTELFDRGYEQTGSLKLRGLDAQ